MLSWSIHFKSLLFKIMFVMLCALFTLVSQLSFGHIYSISHWVCQFVSQSSCQSVSESVSQWVHESVSPSVSEWVSQSVSWSVNQSVSEWVSQSVYASVSQSVSQSVHVMLSYRQLGLVCWVCEMWVVCILKELGMWVWLT